MSSQNPARGDVWMANFDPIIGREQGRMRPCIIISADVFNYSAAQLIVVIPLTTKNRKIPWHIQLIPPEGGLNQASFALCDQIKTISKDRLQNEKLGQIKNSTIYQITERIKLLLEL